MTAASGPFEREAKFWVPALEAFQRHLEAQGARLLQPRTWEYNLRFDTPQGDLTRQRRVLRLRQDRRLTLTYKGPGQVHDGVIQREELEIEVSDLETARRLLEALGYRVVMVYEKFRTLYHWQGVDIALDETPLGTFVEIEGPTLDLVRRRAWALGVDPGRAVPESYASLFQRVREHFGLPVTDLTFEALAPYTFDLTQLGLQPAWEQTP